MHEKWVYNRADIDRAEIVWARDMGSRNRELLEYFDGATSIEHFGHCDRCITGDRRQETGDRRQETEEK